MPLYQQTIYDTENQFDWTQIQTTYDGDNGDIIFATRATYDAGYEIFGIYENGILVKEIYSQPFDTFGFTSRTIFYSSEGQVVEQSTAYQGGFSVIERFENGSRTEVVFDDWAYDDNRREWDTITLTFDENGKISQRQTVNDDSSVETEQFVAGVHELQVDFEQKKSWDSIERFYDVDGGLIQRDIVYDNGIFRQDFYVDGVKLRVVQTDNAGDAGEGVKSWSSVDTTYGSDGKIVERLTDYDNGTTKLETFEAGIRVNMVQVDEDDAKGWDTITTTFEGGIRSERQVELDNGDINVTLYTDGQRTSLIQYDGNESSSWLIRVVDFLEGGGREVATYSAIENVPADALSYFPSLSVAKTEVVLDFNDDVRIKDGDLVLDGAFVVDISQGKNDVQGQLAPYEYGGTPGDADLEAYNSWGATISFSAADDDYFDFASLSLANTSKAIPEYIPEDSWANETTINGYRDGELVQFLAIDLTFEHVKHDIGFNDIDRIEFVATGGGITNSHVENAGWFSMDDLTFMI